MKNILKNQKTENENGRSMIEMLGVLAIIGVLSVGGIAGYSKAMYRYRLNKAIEQITYASGAIRSFFAPQKSYNGLRNCRNDNAANRAACQLYKKAKLLPDDMWDTTAGMYIGVYGYEVNATSTNKAQSGDASAFAITYYMGHTEESIAACIDLFTHDWNSVGAKVIDVGGLVSTVWFKTPVSIELAVNNCESMVKYYQDHNDLGASLPWIDLYFDIDLNGEVWKNRTYAN